MADRPLKTTFITWYPTCRRSDTIAAALGGTSHLIHYLGFKQPLYAPFKYVMQTFATIRAIWRDKPDVVFVASPPTFAVLAVWLIAKISRKLIVVDAHTGLFDDKRWTWLASVNGFLSRGAVATIVTNDHLADIVEEWRAKPIVIGDVPVDFGDPDSAELGPGFHVVVVNTFSIDEPVDDIIAAAALVPEVQFHITGNVKHARTGWTESLPPNARLTGWVTEEEYASLIKSCDAVMCLTTHDYTMQRGAYEAMAMSRPLITSNWNILKDTFSSGTLHVDNSVDEIAAAVKDATQRKDELSQQMAVLADERRSIFTERLAELKQILQKELDRK